MSILNKMDTPSPTQEHCPTCRRTTSTDAVPLVTAGDLSQLVDAIGSLVAKLDELIESQFEECLNEQS